MAGPMFSSILILLGLYFCIRVEIAMASGVPSFQLPVMNITYVAGAVAVLPCSVEHLGDHVIIWSNTRAVTVTFKDRRITDDSRISLERPNTSSWNLHIRDVEPTDAGIYSCHINTSPVKVKRVNLVVHVPPKIISHLSSRDVMAKEGDTVSLVCNVTGIPQPTVTWYRQKKNEDGSNEQVGPPGEVLIIHNVTRYCDDIYICKASNGVPQDAIRKIEVSVQFPPDIRLPITRIGQSRGRETILDCEITAFPLGVMSWERNGRELKKSWKHRIEPYQESTHTFTLSLRIADLDETDFGEYTCVASNLYGKDEETMTLYDATIDKKQTPLVTPTKMIKSPFSNDNRVPEDFYTHEQNRVRPPQYEPDIITRRITYAIPNPTPFGERHNGIAGSAKGNTSILHPGQLIWLCILASAMECMALAAIFWIN